MINKINSVKSTCSCSMRKIDDEHMRIIQRLYEKYGIRSSGNKSVDRAILYNKEKEEAAELDSVSNKFIVLSKAEQESIIEKKKKKKTEANPELFQNTTLGQKILAEQMMVYMQINMQKKIES